MVMAAIVVLSIGGVVAPVHGATQAVPEAGGSSDWRALVAGYDHSCGIRTTGRLYCWGSNQFGQIGRNSTTPVYQHPVEAGGGTWLAVDIGNRFTCGIRATRRLYCWGLDAQGQLGNGAGVTGPQLSPVEVTGGFTDWTAVSTGFAHACGRRATGRLYCWGWDISQQLGDGGTATDRPSPTLVAGGATNWTAVSAGDLHTCGRRATGRLYCWGRDSEGELGNGGTNTERSTPSVVAGGITNWAAVSAGGDHTCARRATGHLYCWGGDATGQLGNGGTNTNRPTPTQVAGGTTNWTSFSAGGGFTCGRRATGRLYCWGQDFQGRLGDGGADAEQPTPAEVAGNATDWAGVSAGTNHACARTSGGRAYCWGDGGEHQLGNGTPADRNRPEEVFNPV
jgi:alpha-tubulin suppressor-like RCC1 family protein